VPEADISIEELLERQYRSVLIVAHPRQII